MSKKEYGKGFTLEDLEAQRQAKWDMRSRTVTTVTRPSGERFEVDGPLWNAMARQDPLPADMIGGLDCFDPLSRASRTINAMFEGINAITMEPVGERMKTVAESLAGINAMLQPANPFLPGTATGRISTQPPPGGGGTVVGTFGGLPVYANPNVPRGGGTSFTTYTAPGVRISLTAYTAPGARSTQVGWAKPEPIPEQPTGRFRNLDWEA